MEPKEMITITKEEYEQMQDEIVFLNFLRKNGVDNWEWYGEACNEYHQSKEGE